MYTYGARHTQKAVHSIDTALSIQVIQARTLLTSFLVRMPPPMLEAAKAEYRMP